MEDVEMKSKAIVLILLLAGSVVWAQNMENAGIDYTTALAKSSVGERIAALETYIKNYPDPAQNVFTKLAYYWLTVNYYNNKNYDKAIRNGEKAIALGGLEAKLEATAYLIMGSSFGVKSYSGFSQEKALKWADKALDFAQKNDVADIVKDAQALKNELSGVAAKPAKELTSLEKIGVLYTQKKYEEAISKFNTFSESDKNDEKIFEIYARSLMAANKLDAAVKEFSDAYAKNRKAINAERLGNIYLEKAKKDKKFYDQAINYYIEAGLLYQKEKNASRQAALNKNAQFWLFEKYEFNARIKKYNATVKPVKPVVSNDKEIKKLERDYDKLERQLNETYGDVEMPGYEQEKLDKIQAQIDKLKAGNAKPAADDPNAAAAAELLKEQQRIEAEFKALTAQAKNKLGL
jgi:tetratricopeptide (TPR) repeat protein